MGNDCKEEKAEQRVLDSYRIELMVAEIGDMLGRHHSAYFKIKCRDAIDQLEKASKKLLELNSSFKKIK